MPNDRPTFDDLDLLSQNGMSEAYRRLRSHQDETLEYIFEARRAGREPGDDANVIARMAWEEQMNAELQQALRRRLDDDMFG